MNKQREVIYKQRSQVLEGENLEDSVQAMIEDVVTSAVQAHLGNIDEDDFEKELGDLIKYLEDIMLPHGKFRANERN